jgi:hypothetical protein
MMVFRHMARKTSLLLIFAGLIISICFFGCKNPFKTRESPEPKTREGTWDTPFLPETVVRNLLNAYNEKVIGNFILCLCDTFRFSAPEDSLKAIQDNREELFANWDKSTEVSVTTSIFAGFRQNVDSISYVLLFDPDPPIADDIGDTTAVLLREYELLIFDVKSDPPETTLARGTATFHMKQTSLNWWSIYFWGDIPEVSGGYDWGDFKAGFRQAPR